MRRLYLLSPASLRGERARILLRPEAAFDLAVRLRTRSGATLGEAFAFLSGLYFRGKLAYAQAFAHDPADVQVITAGRGLLSPGLRVTARDLAAFNDVDIDAEEPRFTRPLVRTVKKLLRRHDDDVQVVLLGSVASGKYVEVLGPLLGDRLVFPECFVGRGDMSRGGILLRAVDAATELTYAPVVGTKLRGKRPEKLDPRTRPRSPATVA